MRRRRWRSSTRRILKGGAVTALSLAALLSLVFMLVGLVQAKLRRPLTGWEEMVFSKLPGPLWENSDYGFFLSARDGQVEFMRYSKRCLSCGVSPADHAPSCIHTWAASVTFRVFNRVDKRLSLPGIDWKSGVSTNSEFVELTISLWLPFVVLAAYPVIAFMRGPLRRHRRRGRGACLNCGYDLTGLPEPRCPECGQPFEPKGDAQ